MTFAFTTRLGNGPLVTIHREPRALVVPRVASQVKSAATRKANEREKVLGRVAVLRGEGFGGH